MKREAKQAAIQDGIPYHQALNRIVQPMGYKNWSIFSSTPRRPLGPFSGFERSVRMHWPLRPNGRSVRDRQRAVKRERRIVALQPIPVVQLTNGHATAGARVFPTQDGCSTNGMLLASIGL